MFEMDPVRVRTILRFPAEIGYGAFVHEMSVTAYETRNSLAFP